MKVKGSTRILSLEIVILFFWLVSLPLFAQSDVGVTRIIAPVGTIDSGSVVVPQAMVNNLGSVPASFPVNFRISTFYNDNQIVSNLFPGDSILVNFVPWLATQLGTHITKCSTALVGDTIPFNDAVTDSVRVIIPGVRDIGIVAVLSPNGYLRDSTEIIPRVLIRNYGTQPETCWVWLEIDGGVMYDESTFVFLLPGDQIVQFPLPWTATPSDVYDGDVWVSLPGDVNPANDHLDFEFTVAKPNTFLSAPPLPVTSRQVKSGGSLTQVIRQDIDQVDTLIFAFKGNKTRDFFAYNLHTWITKAPIPYAPPPDKSKEIKAGAALCFDGGDTIYALKGNNTLEFWAYSVNWNQWTWKPKVPSGEKKVKGGAGLVCATKNNKKYIYCLKGGKTREFYAFDIAANTWLTNLPPAPGGTEGKGFGTGSCIVYDSINNRIYALKGKYNEFFAFDVNGDSWFRNALASMPLESELLGKRKKAKDGTFMTIDDAVSPTIYALKGGSQEFWSYKIATNIWTEKDTIPLGLARKKVKGGGCLVYIPRPSTTKGRGEGEIYALKGNNTDEMWLCMPDTAVGTTKKAGNVELNSKLTKPDFKLSLNPNPCRGNTLLNYELPKFSLLTINIYNVTGSRVTKITQKTSDKNGIIPLEFKDFRTGVYFLEFSFNPSNLETLSEHSQPLLRKLIVHR